MPSINATMRQFFDREAVLSRLPKAQATAMRQGGAYVMQTARHLMKKATARRGSAAPGEAPVRHTSKLRDFLFFAFDPGSGTVIVGPAKLNQVTTRNVPRILEEGGETEGEVFEATEDWHTVNGQAVRRGRMVRKKFTLEARPYMSTTMAMPKVQEKLARIWQDSITRGRA